MGNSDSISDSNSGSYFGDSSTQHASLRITTESYTTGSTGTYQNQTKEYPCDGQCGNPGHTIETTGHGYPGDTKTYSIFGNTYQEQQPYSRETREHIPDSTCGPKK